VAPPKKSGDLTKTGVHLNWPGFVVDQASAVALRDHILLALSMSKSGTDWNEIIDAAVYGNVTRKTKGSGFRMPWSYKRAKHDACGGQGCTDCEKGKVDQLAYLPLFVYRPGPPLSAILNVSQEPCLDILKMAVVRTNEPQVTHVDPPSTKIKEGTFTREETKDELHDEEVKNMVETFIRDNMEGQSSAYVQKMFKRRDTYLVSTTSRYCENLKREHGSNHVWFIISGQTILQKCFCLCETLRGRRDGFCKDFCGRRHQLSRTIVDRLYPKKEELKKCPEIKKFVEKPTVNQSDVKPHIEAFIRKNMNAPEDTHVVSIRREGNKYVTLTTSTYCETIRGLHGDDVVMSYVIDGKTIKQKCPKCKKNTSRTHGLHMNVVKLLKQK
jgi:hypothetical protein